MQKSGTDCPFRCAMKPMTMANGRWKADNISRRSAITTRSGPARFAKLASTVVSTRGVMDLTRIRPNFWVFPETRPISESNPVTSLAIAR